MNGSRVGVWLPKKGPRSLLPVRCPIPLKLSEPFSLGPLALRWATPFRDFFWGGAADGVQTGGVDKSALKTLSGGPLYRRMPLGSQGLTKAADKGRARHCSCWGEGHVPPPALTQPHTPRLKSLPCPKPRRDPKQVTQLPEPSSFSALREG